MIHKQTNKQQYNYYTEVNIGQNLNNTFTKICKYSSYVDSHFAVYVAEKPFLLGL